MARPEESIKAKAREIGFDAAGITTAEPPGHAEHAAAWLAAGMHGEMGYLLKRADLRSGPLHDERLLPGARSVVALGVCYAGPGAADGAVARYARGRDYHDAVREMLNELGAWVEAAWPGEKARGFVDSGPVRERELAARAGLGWQGKHTNLISLDLGNWFFLAALLTTLELTPDAPLASGGHCGTCTRCLAACPTGALVAPQTLDARRCVSYLTIELRGPIPRDLRPLMGARIFGCDDCLAACPWNGHAQASRNLRLAAETVEAAPDLVAWLELLADETAFRAKFSGMPLVRPKREGLRRNVCVALGNVGGPEAVGPLVRALTEDPSPVVRGHAAWALGRIAARLPDCAPACRAALTDALAREADESVRGETAEALSPRGTAVS
jgi:epoxyqueuosine reductase